MGATEMTTVQFALVIGLIAAVLLATLKRSGVIQWHWSTTAAAVASLTLVVLKAAALVDWPWFVVLAPWALVATPSAVRAQIGEG